MFGLEEELQEEIDNLKGRLQEAENLLLNVLMDSVVESDYDEEIYEHLSKYEMLPEDFTPYFQ